MLRKNASLLLILTLAMVSLLLNIVTNDLSNGSAASVPALHALNQWALPALVVLVLLLLGGQALLFIMDRPAARIWSGRRPPYPGLEAFTEDDAGVFFGRERETRELVERLTPALEREAHRFVAVIGPSGSGKSSLVHAGLLPALARQRRRWVVVPPFVPEDRPLASLAESLAELLPGLDVDETALELARDPSAILAPLRELRGGRSASLLLIVDQAEELVTRSQAPERRAFFELLRVALAGEPRLWVVAALRSEFLDGLLKEGHSDLLHQPVVVGVPGRAALFEMIEGPAAQAGIRFSPGLVNRMVDDTGGGDALPMLAYTLQALYLRAGAGGEVTLEDYERLGGVAGALSEQADRVSAELHRADPRSRVVATLLRFVTVDELGPARRRVRRSWLTESEREVVDAFIRARLLVSDSDGSDAVIEVAHEALFRRWPPLSQAVDASAENLRQRSQLERWALDWEHSGRRDSYLLAGERLALAQDWARALGLRHRELPAVAELLEHSARADRAAMARLSDAVATRALANLDRDPELATLLAISAVEECGVTTSASRALVSAVSGAGLRVLRGHLDGCWGLEWAPDGRRLVTTGEDRVALVWDAERGQVEAVLRGHQDGVWKAAWAPDGRLLATVSRDRTLRAWDPTGTQLAVLGLEARPRGLAWSPDSRLLACAQDDGTVRVWDLKRREQLLVVHAHDDWVWGMAWSPDGRLIATASADGTARVSDAVSGQHRLTLYGHTDSVGAVAWSPSGRQLATASGDQTSRVWDARDGTELSVLRGHEDAVLDVAWSPGGRRLITGSDDRTARVWDPVDAACLTILRGHESSVRSVAWSGNGRRLATSSEDRTARVWEAERGPELLVLRGHTTTVQAVAWSLDGRRLATASRDRTARVWDAERGNELLRLGGHEGTVRGIAWSPEDRRVATASTDRTVRIWDADRGDVLAVLRGHGDLVRSVAWAPDGRRLAVGCEDRTTWLWDLERGEVLLRLQGHRDWVRGVRWSPDGSRLATASRDRTARIWGPDSGDCLVELAGHEGTLRGLAWAPEGRRLATVADDDTARIWDVETGATLMVLTGHEDWVRGIAWAPDGRRLATGSNDRTVRVWDLERPDEPAIVGVHAGLVEYVDWSPDGHRLASGSRDHTVRVWNVDADTSSFLALAHQRVARPLTPQERRDAMLPDPPPD